MECDGSWREYLLKKLFLLASSIPVELSVEAFLSLVSIVEYSCVCPGHPDEHFIAMLEAKKGKLLSKNKSAAAHAP